MKAPIIFFTFLAAAAAPLTLAQSVPYSLQPHTVICEGDSLTDSNMNSGLPQAMSWTALLQTRLTALGGKLQVRDLGQSGSKTGGGQAKSLLNRSLPFLPQIYAPYTNIPEISVIYGGTNDTEPISIGSATWSGGVVTMPSAGHGFSVGDQVYVYGPDQSAISGVQTISTISTNSYTYNVAGSGTITASATGGLAFASLDTTTFLRGKIRWNQFGCSGYVTSQTSLPANVAVGTRYVVLYDTDTAGGRALPAGAFSGLSQITGSIANNSFGNSEPTVWQCLSTQSGVTGWSRVARASTTPTHIKRFVIIEQHYMNWAASAGDTQSTQYYLSSSLTPYAVRYNEVAAITLELAAGGSNIVVCNLYQSFYSLISGGTEAQGSFSWHNQNGSPHFSGLGMSYVMDFLSQTITGQPGWLTAISI